MTVELTIFAINSLIRLGKSGIDAYEESARNEDILFPSLKQIRLEFPASIDYYFNKEQNRHYVRGDDAPYAQFWEFDGQVSRPKEDPQSLDALMVLATKIESLEGRTFMVSQTGPAAVLVKTWKEGKEPLSPIARIALVGADIALEYIGNNAGSVGNGNGAKLISAYAKSLSEYLPDDGILSAKDKAVETLSGILLRAGFDTIAKHPDWITNEAHILALIKSTIEPLTKAFPLDSDLKVVEFNALRQTLMEPAAEALLGTLAQHQSAFLGTEFAPDKVLGALTTALFENAKKIGIENQFSQQGLLSLYKASIEVVVDQPELFFGDKQQKRLTKVFASMVEVLSKAEYPFDRQLGIDLAKTCMAALSKNLAKFDENTAPWEKVSAKILSHFIDTLSPTIGKKGALKSVFTEAQLTEYGRIILTQIGHSPSMIVKSNTQVYSGLVTAMANAMAADTKLLLRGDDWLKIVTVAAQEAATNPMRLFNLDPTKTKQVLAGELMKIMVDAASEFAESQGYKSVLFGQTLASAISILIEASAGKVSAVKSSLNEIKALMTALNDFMNAKHEEYGSKEFLLIFEYLLNDVLAGAEVPQLTQDFVTNILTGQNL